jgi:hypothetical protein
MQFRHMSVGILDPEEGAGAPGAASCKKLWVSWDRSWLLKSGTLKKQYTCMGYAMMTLGVCWASALPIEQYPQPNTFSNIQMDFFEFSCPYLSFIFKKTYIYLCIWVSVCTVCIQYPRRQKRAWDPFNMEFQPVVSCYLGTGNQTRILCRGSKYS